MSKLGVYLYLLRREQLIIQEPSNTRTFKIEVEVDFVDVDKLTDVYTGGKPESIANLISMLEYKLEG